MDNKHIFSSNLIKYMQLNNKTRNDISDALGISYYTVTDWVKGKKYPRMDKVELLANYFGIQKSDLIEDKTNSPEYTNLSEGEKMWLELYHRLSSETRELIITSFEKLDTLPEDRQRLVRDVILVALQNKK